MKTQTTMMGMQLEMVACSKEFALSESAPADFMGKTFVSSPKPLTGIESAKLVRYRIRPMDDANDFEIPSNDNQKVRTTGGGKVLVVVRPVPMPDRARFGYSGNDPEVLDALLPNQFVQSDNEKIKQLAGQAVGETNNAAEAARKIESFVADYIDETTLSVGYASAAEAADSRQGDCTEFAVLTAALCRAAGIPARIAVGVAYVDEFMGYENVYGGHAWTEAYIKGKWIGLDSAFKASGRGGYDAGHIALATGSGELEDYFSLLFNIGQFEIEEVDIQK
jgi:transglutaminase-like putative cysteine protease